MDDQVLTKEQSEFLAAFKHLPQVKAVTKTIPALNIMLQDLGLAKTNPTDSVNVKAAKNIKKKTNCEVTPTVNNPYKKTNSKVDMKKKQVRKDTNSKVDVKKKQVSKDKLTPKKNQARKDPKPQIAIRLPKVKVNVVTSGAKDLLKMKMDNTHKGSPQFEDVMNLNNQDFEPTQINWTDALKTFKNELGVLNHAEYEETMNELTSKNARWVLQQKQGDLIKEAKFLSCMHNVCNVKYIAWVPDNKLQKTPLQYSNSTLKGHYICQYLDENKDLQTVELNTEWVEANFNVVLLSYAQKQAY